MLTVEFLPAVRELRESSALERRENWTEPERDACRDPRARWLRCAWSWPWFWAPFSSAEPSRGPGNPVRTVIWFSVNLAFKCPVRFESECNCRSEQKAVMLTIILVKIPWKCGKTILTLLSSQRNKSKWQKVSHTVESLFSNESCRNCGILLETMVNLLRGIQNIYKTEANCIEKGPSEASGSTEHQETGWRSRNFYRRNWVWVSDGFSWSSHHQYINHKHQLYQWTIFCR